MMEKRLFLAMFLSLLVLWFWTLFVAPPVKVKPNTSQHIYNKQVAYYVSDDNPNNVITPFETSPPSLLSVEEKIYTLENDRLRAEFSNIGGKLIKLTLKEYNHRLPLKDFMVIAGFEKNGFEVVDFDNHIIRFRSNNEEFTIEQEYTFQNEYLLKGKTTIHSINNMSKLNSIIISPFLIDSTLLDIKNNISNDNALNEYVIFGTTEIRKNNAFKFSPKEEVTVKGGVKWIGFRDRYFSLIFNPLFPFNDVNLKVLNEHEVKFSLSANTDNLQLQAGIELESEIFFGPENSKLLKKYGNGFENIKKFYRMGLFDGVAKVIYKLMHFCHRIIPNWGVVIILISTLIYFSMYPLTLKGMSSMKKMQELQPKIAALKDKYKNSPDKLNKEVIGLYREYKINPMGGCFPLLLQMPVFIGLYQVLWRDVSFKGANFLWIKDLSSPDRLFILPFNIPFLGNEINILPVIMMVVMYFQQKLSSKSMSLTDPAQITQQKMMTTIMPIFLGFIFYKFASGLTLYFTMFYMFSTVTQLKVMRVKG